MWKSHEVQFLLEHYGKLPAQEIADYLGRSMGAVCQKAMTLGLKGMPKARRIKVKPIHNRWLTIKIVKPKAMPEAQAKPVKTRLPPPVRIPKEAQPRKPQPRAHTQWRRTREQAAMIANSLEIAQEHEERLARWQPYLPARRDCFINQYHWR